MTTPSSSSCQHHLTTFSLAVFALTNTISATREKPTLKVCLHDNDIIYLHYKPSNCKNKRCSKMTHKDIKNQHMNLNNGYNQKCHAAMHAGNNSTKLPACITA